MSLVQDPAGGGSANVTDATTPVFTGKKALVVAISNQDGSTPETPQSVRLSDGTSYYKATTPSDTQPVSAASLPLPSGAATAAKQPTLGVSGTPSSDVITVQGVTSMTPLKIDGSAVTQPVSAAALPLPSGAATSAKQPALGVAGTPSVDVLSIQGISNGTAILTKYTRSSTAAVSNVSAAATDTLVLATNANRIVATVFNDSTATLYLKFGSGSSSTSFTVMLSRNDFIEISGNDYTGALYGTWSSATGAARVTEVS